MASNNLTTAQVAEMYGVSVRTVHRMVNDGELKPADKLPTKTGPYLFAPTSVARAFRKKNRDKVEVAA